MKQKTKYLSLITLICLTLMLCSTSVLASGEDQTAPTMTGITVEFQDGTTVTGTSEGIECAQGQVVDSIKVTMSEPVSVVENAVVQMKGTSGECVTAIPDYVTYGKIALDPSDTTKKTIIITPNGSNNIAGYYGEMTFKAADGAVKDLSDNACTQTFVLTVREVLPVGDGITPATGTDIDGEQTFTFPFKTTKGTLTELGLDLYLGDSTGAGVGTNKDYNNASQVNLDADATKLNAKIDEYNTAFKNATSRDQLVGTYGENGVKFFEAAGFRVGQDKAAAVKSNIQYTSTDGNVTGTWTLKLNTYMLKADKLEILTQVENSEGDQWGNNDYTHYGDLTKAFLYNLTQDTTAPTVSNILVTFTDNTTTTITKTPYGAEFLLCTKGKVVKNITVTMSEPVTVKKDAIISMEGTMGDCADAISSKTTYGTVSLDASDPSDKTLTVTPSGSNGTAGYLGEMKFYVDSDTVSDLAGNDEEDPFYLIVGSKFNDVNSNVWYYNAITALSAAKIVQGTGNNMFDPAANITRADFLIMIMNTAEIKPATTWTDNFSDAGTNQYYSGYLAKAKELGIVNGVGNNMFAPNANITRQDMVTMMFNTLYNMELSESQRAKLNDLSAFSDRGDIANYAYFPFQFFVTYGVIAGEGNNMLCPQNLATRAEAAQMIYNLMYNGLDI